MIRGSERRLSVKSEDTAAGSGSDAESYIDNESINYNGSINLNVLNTSNTSTDQKEILSKVRNRRTQDSNRFSICMKELRSFQSNNLNHMIVSSPSIKKCSDKSFNQFFLLSALPTDIISNKNDLASISNLSRPFFCKAVNGIDKYPLTSPDSSFSKEEVASVCFPSGVQIRFIPRCAKEMALKKGLVGQEGDRYQLHTVSESSTYIYFQFTYKYYLIV